MKILIPSRKRRIETFNAIGMIVIGVPGEIMIACILSAAVFEIVFRHPPLGFDVEFTSGQPSINDLGWMIMLVAAFVALGAAVLLIGIYALQWQSDGKEIIEVDSNGIVVQRQASNTSRRKEYFAERVTNLRSVPKRVTWRRVRGESVFLGEGWGLIALDYDGRTRRFGSGLDETGAERIVATINEKFPQYGRY